MTARAASHLHAFPAHVLPSTACTHGAPQLLAPSLPLRFPSRASAIILKPDLHGPPAQNARQVIIRCVHPAYRAVHLTPTALTPEPTILTYLIDPRQVTSLI